MNILGESYSPATGYGSTATGTKPTGTVAGDALVAEVTSDNIVVSSPPAGWTLIASAGTVERVSSYIRVAGASEPASYAWGMSGSGVWAVGIRRYSGVDPSTPLDCLAATARVYGFNHGVGPITTVTDGAMLIGGMVINNSGGTLGAPTVPGAAVTANVIAQLRLTPIVAGRLLGA